jgi:4-amino-4-deoxy-L-arabinose transferase-like glycosyltransferase
MIERAAGPTPMLAGSLTVLTWLALAALFGRLGGARFLPPAPVLAAVALVLLGARGLLAHRHAMAAAIRDDWRGLAARRGFAAGLIALTLLSVLVRLPALGADLGHQPLDIDEHRVAANVKQFFVTGEIGHRTVEHYPGILFWMLTGTSLLVYLHGLLEGAFASVRGMPVETFVFAGRLTSTLIGAATVAVVGLIGRQMSGGAAGLIAAAILAVAPLSLQTTTALRNDGAQVLFVCAAIHAALAAAASDRRRWPLLAGLFGGLATAIKYTSVFTLAPALLAAALRGASWSRAARAGLVLVAFVPAVLATNHFLWWDFPNFVTQLSDQIGITGPGHWGALENPAAFHTRILADFGVGWALLILGAGCGAWGLATGRPRAWAFWVFPLLYSWFTTKRPSQFPRWVFPLLPLVAVAAAGALVWAVALVSGRRAAPPAAASRLRVAAAALVALALVAQPAWNSLVLISRQMTPPTHTLVEQWLRERPAGGRVLLGEGWLALEDGPLTVRRVPDLSAALGGPITLLAAHDWIVVPEPFFRHAGLKRLSFVSRVRAEQRAFGGNVGYDYEVYAPPQLPPAGGPMAIDVAAAGAGEYLGLDWEAPAPDRPGRGLPARGASLYLPPRPAPTARLFVELTAEGQHEGGPPLTIEDAAGPVVLADSATPGARTLTGLVRLAPGGRATELRLTPASRRLQVRVVRIEVE